VKRDDMRPWKKGWYGNPYGVPDGLVSRALRECLLRRVGDEETWDGKMVVDVLVEAAIEHAMRGNFRFTKLIFEWCDGPLDRTVREFEAHPRIALNIVPAPPRLPAETPSRAGDGEDVAGGETRRPRNLLAGNGE
jgi:hypothetical protein